MVKTDKCLPLMVLVSRFAVSRDAIAGEAPQFPGPRATPGTWGAVAPDLEPLWSRSNDRPLA
jgi:hypothetical protein